MYSLMKSIKELSKRFIYFYFMCIFVCLCECVTMCVLVALGVQKRVPDLSALELMPLSCYM